jgi:hypothetical protein
MLNLPDFNRMPKVESTIHVTERECRDILQANGWAKELVDEIFKGLVPPRIQVSGTMLVLKPRLE